MRTKLATAKRSIHAQLSNNGTQMQSSDNLHTGGHKSSSYKIAAQMMLSSANTKHREAGGRNIEKNANMTGSSVKTAGGGVKPDRMGESLTIRRQNPVVQSQPTDRKASIGSDGYEPTEDGTKLQQPLNRQMSFDERLGKEMHEWQEAAVSV